VVDVAPVDPVAPVVPAAPVAPVVLLPLVLLLPTPVVSVWLETPGVVEPDVLLPAASGVVLEVPGVVLGVPVVVLGVPCVVPIELELPVVSALLLPTLPLVPVWLELPVALESGVLLVVPAVFPGIELLLPVPDAPVVV